VKGSKVKGSKIILFIKTSNRLLKIMTYAVLKPKMMSK